MTKRFDSRTILDRVSLKIYEGQITTLIGKSGAGKSMLLKHIIGLLKPDEGTILFKGKPLDQMSNDVKNEIMNQIFEIDARFSIQIACNVYQRFRIKYL